MYIKNRMTVNPICISKKTSISDALYLMNKNNFHRLPIVENGKLVGLITEGTITAHSPTQATSLSIHELNYLLSKTTVEEIMITDVKVIDPEALLEAAAVEMRSNSIGCLPVVENETVVGIITQNDIFDSFIDLLGYYTEGYRYHITVSEDHPGILSSIAAIFFDEGANITNLAVYHRDEDVDVVIRANNVRPQQIQEKLKEKGFNSDYS
ncbi:MAG: CBS and ACT domain-containing protein [Anaerorhabdus sp.]